MDAAAVVGEDVLTWRELLGAGVPSTSASRAVERGRLVRVLPRVYAARPLPAWPARLVGDGPVAAHVLHVRAVLLTLGPGACAVGPTAAALHGWGLLHEPVGTVHVLVPHGRTRARARRARVQRSRRVVGQDLRPCPVLGPVRVALPVDTLVQCLALPLEEAVVVVDSALRSGAVRWEEVERGLLRARGRRRRARARRVLDLADPEAGSVLESVMRVRMLQAGLDGFVTQRVVADARGRHVLRADFCFEAARLVVEVDGSRWHEARRDQAVDNALAAAGWRVLRFGWAEVVHDPDRVLELVRAALAA